MSTEQQQRERAQRWKRMEAAHTDRDKVRSALHDQTRDLQDAYAAKDLDARSGSIDRCVVRAGEEHMTMITLHMVINYSHGGARIWTEGQDGSRNLQVDITVSTYGDSSLARRVYETVAEHLTAEGIECHRAFKDCIEAGD